MTHEDRYFGASPCRAMLTVAHRVENGGKGEDRLIVEHHGARTLAIVADGAGGMGGGAVAAEMACFLLAQSMRTTVAGTPEFWARRLGDVDQALVAQGSGGQCTAVVVEISESRACGASVGDSGAWMIASHEILDLTERQRRKPLLGSGEALPVSFGQIALSGRLLLGTDGLFKYATRHHIRERAFAGHSLSTAVDTLVEGLRLRGGAFQDDVAIILVECVV
jgi:serine/threonine protein phosphatase PrpC